MSKAKNARTPKAKSAPLPSKRKDSNFIKRVMSGVMIIAITVAAIYIHPWALVSLVALLSGVAVYEWARMVLPENKGAIFALSAVVSTVYVLLMAHLQSFVYVPVFVLGFAAVLRQHAAFRGIDFGLDRFMIGFCYISLGFVSLALMAMHKGAFVPGPFNDLVFMPFDPVALKLLLMGVFLTVWASDTTAYLFGKTIGGKKMAPKISPNKTWAGLTGSMFGAALAVSGTIFLVRSYFDVTTPDIWMAACFGALMGIVGQIGDLIISKYKREYNIKDTGALIPGHGGVLDRVDALILIAPCMLFAFKAVF